MRMITNAVCAVAMSIALAAGTANAMVIASEDFEGGATGWSNNTTTLGGANFTEFLGRFGGTGGTQTARKTFALSGTQTEVTVAFDFYEIDSWDGEQFILFVNDVVILSQAYNHNGRDEPGPFAGGAGTITNLLPVAGNIDLGFGGFADQTYRYTYTFASTASSVKLGFGTTLNQAVADESWGIDNVEISTNGAVTAMPEPAAAALAGIGLLGLAAVVRRGRAKSAG